MGLLMRLPPICFRSGAAAGPDRQSIADGKTSVGTAFTGAMMRSGRASKDGDYHERWIVTVMTLLLIGAARRRWSSRSGSRLAWRRGRRCPARAMRRIISACCRQYSAFGMAGLVKAPVLAEETRQGATRSNSRHIRQAGSG